MRLALALLFALTISGCASTDEPAVDDPAPATAPVDDDDAAEQVGDAAAPAGDAGSDAAPDELAPADTAGAPPADAPAGSAGTRVAIVDFAFDADVVEVVVGDTVTWTHEGRITHNVTARDDAFASDNLAAGETFAHTFTEPGTFVYVCTLHSQMTAEVIVG